MNKLRILENFIRTRITSGIRSHKRLNKYQTKRLKRQLNFIKKNSVYFKNIDVENGLKALPVMNKKLMMEHFNELNTVGVDRDKALDLAIKSEKSRDFKEGIGDLSVGLSSGTSGSRGLFITSPKEREMWTGSVLAKLLPRKRLFGNKIAFFLRADNSLYQSVNSAMIELKYFDIMRDMNVNLNELNEYSPTIISAPPSVLLLLSKAKTEGKLDNVNPIKIISVAEVLENTDKEYIKEAFSLEIIHQVYQCTEGFLGYTCEYGNFHLNEDIVYFEREYIGDGRFVPIVTDFMRTSQPIIRYRLNDVLVEKNGNCPCGSCLAMIERIEGREDDTFKFCAKDGKNTVTVFSDFIVRCVIYTEGVREYRVIQTSANEVEVQLDTDNSDVREKIRSEFERLSEKMNFTMPTITFSEYINTLDKKLKRVERRF